MDENPPAATAQDLRDLQDRYLQIPSVAERIASEGWGGHVHGPASPTFERVRQAPVYGTWADWIREFVAKHDPVT